MWKNLGWELFCSVENICVRTNAQETLIHLFDLLRQFLPATHITEETAISVLQCSSSRNDLVSSELQSVLTEVIHFLLFPHLHPTQDSDGPSRQDSVQPPVFPALRKSRVVSSTSEEEEALTEKFLKINCKYITDGKVRRRRHCHRWWAHRDTVAPFWSCYSIISYVWLLFIPCLWYLSLFSRIHA